jgi:hypothetical protein
MPRHTRRLTVELTRHGLIMHVTWHLLNSKWSLTTPYTKIYVRCSFLDEGKDEDTLLRSVDTDYVVVMSPGTEYINGTAFFDTLEQLVQQDDLVRGDYRHLDALNKFACVSAAWQTLARGGEVTNGARSGWSAARDATRADLTFHTAGSARYAVLMLRPLKKRGQAVQPKVPQYIAEHDGGPSDTYAALARLVRLDPVEPALRADTPLFRLRSGNRLRPMSVEDVRNTIRSYAAAIGYTNPLEWGAHSARIGGATDLCSQGSCSEVLLAAKGRWGSDIGKIYARMTRRAQLRASRLMQAARGRCVEELIPGFTQAA